MADKYLNDDEMHSEHRDRSLFDTFKHDGYFWLPETPGREVAGAVTVSNDEIQVVLHGSLSEIEFEGLDTLRSVIRWPIVLGRLQGGRLVTFVQCRQGAVSFSFEHGAQRTTLRARTMLVGEHFASVESLRFHSAFLNYTNHEQWFGFAPFAHEEERDADRMTAFASRYVVPPRQEYRVDSLNAIIAFDFELRISGSMTFDKESREHVAFFVVQPDEEQSLDWFLERVVDLQELFTLFVAEPQFANRMILRESDKHVSDSQFRERVNVFFGDRNRTPVRRLHPGQMLVPFSVVSEIFGTILNEWHSKRKALETVHDLYFGAVHNSRMFLQFRFLALVQAIETYCRRTQPGQYLPDDEYEEFSRALRNAIPASAPPDLSSTFAHSGGELCEVFEGLADFMRSWAVEAPGE